MDNTILEQYSHDPCIQCESFRIKDEKGQAINISSSARVANVNGNLLDSQGRRVGTLPLNGALNVFRTINGNTMHVSISKIDEGLFQASYRFAAKSGTVLNIGDWFSIR